jgi:DeoR/GlpR family transcriptional regulator of sugar metabolism
MQKRAEASEARILMFTEERRRYIVDLLQREGKVVAADLSARLDVSEDTIRRDLRGLARLGVLQRVHGGALPRSPSDPRYTVRQQESPEAKLAIAEAAAQLVQPGQIVILDAGTTTLEIAQHLPLDLQATVITNGPPIAIALAEHQMIEVIVVGGELHKPSLANIGAATVQAFDAIRADLCFLGVAGIHQDVGVSILAHEEIFVKRAMIAGAGDVVAVSAGDKLGTVAPYVVGPIDVLSRIVAERSVPEAVLEPYRRRDISIVLG